MYWLTKKLTVSDYVKWLRPVLQIDFVFNKENYSMLYFVKINWLLAKRTQINLTVEVFLTEK